MSKVKVLAGICGFTAIIRVLKVGDYRARVEIASPCEMLKEMNTELKEIDWTENITRKMGDSNVYRAADKHITHAACPVPSAILKAVEVEFGLALPRDVNMVVEGE